MSEIEALRKAVQDLQNKNQFLNKELAKCLAGGGGGNGGQSPKEKELEEQVKQKTAELEACKSAAAEAVKKAEDHLANARKMVENQSSEAEKAKKELEEAKSDRETTEKENAKLKEELESCKNAAGSGDADLKTKVAELEQQHRDCKNAKEKADLDAVKSLQDINDLKQQLEQCEKKRKLGLTQLSTALMLSEHFKQELEECQKAKKEAEDKAAQGSPEEIASLKQQLAGCEQANKEAEGKEIQCQTDKAKAENEARRLAQEKAALEGQILTIRTDLEIKPRGQYTAEYGRILIVGGQALGYWISEVNNRKPWQRVAQIINDEQWLAPSLQFLIPGNVADYNWNKGVWANWDILFVVDRKPPLYRGNAWLHTKFTRRGDGYGAYGMEWNWNKMGFDYNPVGGLLQDFPS